MAEKKQDLSKSRQALLDKLLTLFEGKHLDWTKGWSQPGAPLTPESGVYGTKYHGNNNMLLWLVSIERGYRDNRWVTYRQIEENGWHFKKNENGDSLGKGAGVPIELFRYYDTTTKKDLDWREFKKLTLDEQSDYWKKNVRTIARHYIVFNGAVVEGMPPMQESAHITQEERDERSEQIIRAWNDKQCRVIHDGGNQAYYNPSKDEIHLPERTAFHTIVDYYGTALHEIGHATGHSSRLNRNLSGMYGTAQYAKEELRAEFASVFMQQELELPMSKYHIENHAAYLQAWGEEVKKNPDVLFEAIKDADKIAVCVFENAAGMEAASRLDAAQSEQTTSSLMEMVSNMPGVEKGAEKSQNEQTTAYLGENTNE